MSRKNQKAVRKKLKIEKIEISVRRSEIPFFKVLTLANFKAWKLIIKLKLLGKMKI